MIIDIIVLAVLLISALIAFLRGFIREVLTIAGVVGGLAAAYFGGPHLIPHMAGWLGIKEGEEVKRLFDIIPYDLLATVLSYGAIFIVVVIILSIVSHFLAETAKKFGLGAIDRTLGFIFGLLRGVVILGLLYMPVHLFVEQDAKESWFANSKTQFYLEKTSAFLAGFLPEDTTKALKEEAEKMEDTNATRKKLEEIDLLKKQEDQQATPAQPESNNGEGYNDEFRQNMDQLIEENAKQYNQ
ncbi:MAG: CvpA family protein [Alphaproteobacteria bacterium]|nr:CvpA family protein [Alphaproteobacteria bacterium]